MTPDQIEKEFRKLRKSICCGKPKSYTTAERDLIANPVIGKIIFNSTTKKLNFWDGTDWAAITSTT